MIDVHQQGRDYERNATNINPGGWLISRDWPIATLLGSCVAVCLYDPRLRLMGMNHFLLPTITQGNHADTDVVLNGDYAMEVLVNGMLNQGAHKERLVAKAFGGGNIVSAIRMAIGDRNANFAREWLEREGIPLVAADLGGPWSRKVVCIPATGDAFSRRIAATQQETLNTVQAEAEYEKNLLRPQTKRVELF
ncbi:MAG: chemotaxis protein CheD [Rhodocyclaceae bacterium]|nr:MAG: chemotaxis protein CheD [Rhodocyclaceae bacterium]